MKSAGLVHRGISALILVVSLFLPNAVLAARPDSLKDILSDSRASTDAIHDIYLDQATGTTFASGETILINFPSGFTNVSSLTYTDITLFKDGASTKTIVNSCSSGNVLFEYVSGQQIRFTACSGYSGTSGSIIQITIGNTNKVTNNSTPGSYQLTVSGTYGDDSQDTVLVITSAVTLSATIDETLTLTVAGVTTANCPDVGTETEINTSGDATTIPFGTVNTEAFYGACQQLTVGTNAGGGYTTAVKTTTRPTSGSNTIAKGNCDGSCSDSTAAGWATSTNNGYGYCMKDNTGTSSQTADAAWGTNYCGAGTTYFKTIARADNSENAVAIMSKTSGTSGDDVYIKYRLSVDGTQPAGTYTTIIIYITTGTF